MTAAKASVYYKDSGKVPLASRVSFAARQRMFNRFMEVMRPSAEMTILDIGVTSDISFRESNFFEQFYPFKQQIVCVGTEEATSLESIYPGVRFQRVEPGRPLPFSDRQFDIAFSNAVVEHVGEAAGQRAFIAEACRVARRVFITTPNRWFPIEHHTGVPLLHYLPKTVYRRLIHITPLEYWSHPEHLNLLTQEEFAAVFPNGYPVQVERVGIGWGPFTSNLVGYSS